MVSDLRSLQARNTQNLEEFANGFTSSISHGVTQMTANDTLRENLRRKNKQYGVFMPDDKIRFRWEVTISL